MGTKSFTFGVDFFLPRLRLLVEVLRVEVAADCRLEVEVETGRSVAVAAAAGTRLPTVAVRDSLSVIFVIWEGTSAASSGSGIFYRITPSHLAFGGNASSITLHLTLTVLPIPRESEGRRTKKDLEEALSLTFERRG